MHQGNLQNETNSKRERERPEKSSPWQLIGGDVDLDPAEDSVSMAPLHSHKEIRWEQIVKSTMVSALALEPSTGSPWHLCCNMQDKDYEAANTRKAEEHKINKAVNQISMYC
jgi:hypothetical protein